MTTEANPTEDTAPITPENLLRFLEAFKVYESGKHRRYELLFAVNGGAFAIAQLIWDKPKLGALTLQGVAAGMVLFSIAMVVDIFLFGSNWHAIGQEIIGQQMNAKDRRKYTIFGKPGRLVLAFMGLLLSAGWTLTASFWR